MVLFSTWDENSTQHFVETQNYSNVSTCEVKENKKMDAVEGFLNIGGSDEVINKSHTEIIREAINRNINKTFTTTKTSQTSLVTGSQTMDIDMNECDRVFAPIIAENKKRNSEEQERQRDRRSKCVVDMMADKTSPEQAAKLCLELNPELQFDVVEPCRVSGLTQKMTLEFKKTEKVESSDVEKLQKDLKDNLKKSFEKEDDAVGTALNDVVDVWGKIGGNISKAGDIGTSSKTTTENTTMNKNTIIQEVVDIVDEKFVKETYNTLAGDQMLRISGGSASNISQDMTLTFISEITSKNEKFKSLISKIERAEEEVEKQKTKGLTDVVETTGKTVDNAVDKGADVANTGMGVFGDISKYGMTTVLLPFIVCAALIICLAVIAFWQSGAINTATEGAVAIGKAKAGAM